MLYFNIYICKPLDRLSYFSLDIKQPLINQANLAAISSQDIYPYVSSYRYLRTNFSFFHDLILALHWCFVKLLISFRRQEYNYLMIKNAEILQKTISIFEFLPNVLPGTSSSLPPLPLSLVVVSPELSLWLSLGCGL